MTENLGETDTPESLRRENRRLRLTVAGLVILCLFLALIAWLEHRAAREANQDFNRLAEQGAKQNQQIIELLTQKTKTP